MLPWVQDVVRIWQDLAKTAKMLVRGSTRANIGSFLLNTTPPRKFVLPDSLISESLRTESYTTIIILTNEMFMGEIMFKQVGRGETTVKTPNILIKVSMSGSFLFLPPQPKFLRTTFLKNFSLA